jgi:hypothetical protein
MVALSFLLLAAHFLRDDNILLTAISLLLPWLLLLKRPFVPVLLQTALFLGAVLWSHTCYSLIRLRLASGADWLRMALILTAVVLFTIGSGLLLSSPVVKKRYQQN